jgi:hypothetical protein
VPASESGLRGCLHVSQFPFAACGDCAQTKKHRSGAKADRDKRGDGARHDQTARKGGIVLGVVSQHRFDDSSQFLSRPSPKAGWASCSNAIAT